MEGDPVRLDQFRREQAEAMLEDQLQTQTIALARPLGWLWYHTHDSRRSPGGFPDLVLVRGPRLIFAELKKQDGRYRPGQKEWLRAVERAGAEAYTWRPLDLLDGTIRRLLTAAPNFQREERA